MGIFLYFYLMDYEFFLKLFFTFFSFHTVNPLFSYTYVIYIAY